MTNFQLTWLIIKDTNCLSPLGYKLETTWTANSSADQREETARKVGIVEVAK